MKKFLICDGNSMLFKAYYATASRPMSTSAGIPTNAVFGFAQMIHKALEIVHPDAFLVAFDAGKHTFRHDLYEAYKGGRKPAPDDLVPQFGLARELLEAYHVKWVEMPDIEADDLIGTMTKKAEGFESYILTSDHDMLQLIDDETTVLLMKKGLTEMDIMTPTSLKESMGIEPLQIIDMKGLMGDSSDNIPGIPGVGEKTALKLLAEYGTMENVLANVDNIKGALHKKIIEGRDSAILSKKLATIRRNVDVALTAEECTFSPDIPGIVKYLETLEMKMLVKRFSEMLPMETNEELPAATSAPTSFERVQRVPGDMLKDDLAIYVNEDLASFMHAEMRGIALANATHAVYIALDDLKQDEALLAFLNASSPAKIGYDVKRCEHICQREGISINFTDDTMIMASLVDSTLTSTDKIMDAFGLSTSDKYEDIYGKANKPIMLVEEENETRFSCENARNILELHDRTVEKLIAYGMEDLYRNIEMPLTHILREMESIGIRCDVGVLDQIASQTKTEIDNEQAQIFTIVGHEFNVNSPKQLAEVLYDEMGLKAGKKRSTAADALEKLAGKHPVINHILAYRKWSKIYSTYAEGLKKYVQRDGRIHTVYNQAATQTGRLSSSEPNLQNISVRSEEGRGIRKAFLPDEGCVLISSDYHQVELRMLAHMADEESLIKAFKEGIDIHTKTAMDVFHKTEEEVTPADRRKAKAVNFGIVYGISDFGLAEQIGVSVKEAGAFIEDYYLAYPRIKTYMNSLVEECEKKGYVSTLCGRRRDIPEIRNKNRQIREFGKRAAMNAPIQGSAADLIKIAMIDIDKAMKEAGVKSRMILQVHDELIFNVPKDEIELMEKIIDDGMTHAMELKVPLTAECSVGENWYEAK